MRFKQLTIVAREHGGFDVLAEGHIAEHLGRDEALGCIASWLFTANMPMYMQTLEQRAEWHAKHPVLE